MVKTKSSLIKIILIVFLSLLMMTGGIVFLCNESATPPSQMEEKVDEVEGIIDDTSKFTVKMRSYGSRNRGIKFQYRVTSGYKGDPRYSSNRNTDGNDVRRYGNITDAKKATYEYTLYGLLGQNTRRFEFRSNAEDLATNITGGKATINEAVYDITNMSGNHIETEVSYYTTDVSYTVNFYFNIELPIDLNKGTVNDGTSYNGKSATSLYRRYLTYNCYSNAGSDVTTTYSYETGGGIIPILPDSSSIYTGGAQTKKAVLPGGMVTVTLKPTRKGYTWKGFGTTSSGGTQIVDANGNWKLNRDSNDLYPRTAYAMWTANKYTVTANSNGGINAKKTGWTLASDKKTSTKFFTFDQAASALPTATRTGYTLAGWYTEASGGTKVANADGTFIASVEGYTDANKKWVRDSDTTFYAHWTVNSYKITANANGGINATKDGWTLASDKTTSTMNFTYGQAASAMPTATRTGHTHAGWYTQASGGTKVANANGTFIASISGYTDANKKWIRASATTLYAHWTANSYTITADANGGTNAAKDGWTLASDKKTSTMNFTYGQAANEMPSVTAPIGKRRAITGWFTSASGGTKVADADGTFLASIDGYTDANKKWIRTSATTLYAQYAETIMTVKYHLNGGTDVESDANFTSGDPCRTDKWRYSYESQYGLTNCTDISRVYRTGYTASAYYNTKSDNTGNSIHQDNLKTTIEIAEAAGVLETLKTQDVTINIYMIWQINSYSLTIEPDNGLYNGSTAKQTISQNYNTTYAFKTATRTGHTFKGWNIGRNLIGSARTFDGSSTFVTLGRTYMYTDKIFISVRASMTSWAEYKTGTMRMLSCTEGGGWNFEPKNGYVQFACYDSGVGYKSVKTSVKWDNLSSGYHTFSGSFDGEYARAYVDGILVGTSVKFSSGKIGYHASNGIFVGAEAATTTTTPAGSYFKGTIDYVTIVNSLLTKPSTFTFKDYNAAATAHWTVNNYTLTADANSGSIATTTGWSGTGAKATKTVAYNAAYGTLPTPSKTGYGFAGWYTAASGGTQVSASTRMGAVNTTIYAHWNINSYTLTANCNGGSAPSTLPTGWTANGTSPYRSLNYNSTYGSLPEPTRQGYIFAGWWTQASGGSEVSDGTKIGAADVTIYAHWVESWVKHMSNGNPAMDQADGYYKIDSAEKLARLAYLINYNIDGGKWASYKYKQTADIDLSAHYWQPIGNTTYQFKGTFDGTTFDIHNMKTYCGANDYEAYNRIGMFGYIGGAKIKNVNNYDVNIAGRQRTGAIAGRDDSSTIQNCKVSGAVTGKAGYIGGLVGVSYKNNLIECENHATVKGDFDVGGIVGNSNQTTITNCVNYGTIQGRNATGGIGGYKHYNNVVNCINRGNIIGSGQYIGGIVGSYAGANVQNCTNEGLVQGTTIVGGIVGYIQTGAATILNGLNTGTLKATAANSEVGGIAGRATIAITITSSFVDCSITPVSTSKVGGIVGNATKEITITYCGANVKVTAAASTVQPFYNAASGVTVTCNDSYSLVNNNGTKINRITATSSGMDGKFGMVSSIHDGLPIPLGIYHISQYGTTTGIASTLKGSKYGCTTA